MHRRSPWLQEIIAGGTRAARQRVVAVVTSNVKLKVTLGPQHLVKPLTEALL